MTPHKNIAASVRDRLLNQSRKADGGSGFNRLLVQYVIERFLYRMSLSKARDRFILKGAVLFVLWSPSPLRTTGDLDLLGLGANDTDTIGKLFVNICREDVPDDGLVFDHDAIKVESMRAEEQYPGVRVRLAATLGTAKIPFQVDIGFGDVIHPGPDEIEYPRLLTEFPPARLRAYPPETVIAEKLEAMVRFDELTSRLKDHYDMWAISHTFGFEMSTLSAAVMKTFERRKMTLPPSLPAPLSLEFASLPAKRQQWQAFLKLASPTLVPPVFEKLEVELTAFIGPVLAAVRSGHANGHWSPDRGWSDVC